MILLTSVVVGLPAGWLRAHWKEARLQVPDIHFMWLAFFAFLPQWLAFYFPPTRRSLPDGLASVILVASQALLLAFIWHNRRLPGFKWIGLGLLLNLLVILLNGGLMPTSPEALQRLIPERPLETWALGERLGASKDILLQPTNTHLWWLSDQMLLPAWIPYRAVFSLGDTLIAAGAFWFLFSAGAVETVSFGSAGEKRR